MKADEPALAPGDGGGVTKGGREMDGDGRAEVVDRGDRHRFEVVADGRTAELVYEVHGRHMVLVHTGVPDEMAGQGVGGRLVEAAIARAARDGLDIVPRCPFARRWIESHPEALGSVRMAG